MNLARGDHIDYNLAMSLIQYLENEEHYIPWLSAFNNLAYIARRFKTDDLLIYKVYTSLNSKLFASFFEQLSHLNYTTQKHILKLMENVYKKLGFTQQTTDGRLDIYNRANILLIACKYGHEECIRLAKADFERLQSETTNFK